MNTSIVTTTPPPTRPTCDGDHWMRDSTGRFMWCLEVECIVHGSGREW